MTAATWVRSHAHGDAAVESAYERYCDRTMVDWMGAYAFCAGAVVKVPEVTEFLGNWLLPFLAGVLLFPIVAIVLGVTRAREAFVKILRGRGSWVTAGVLGFACGAISYALTTAGSSILVKMGGSRLPAANPGDSFAYTFATVAVLIPIVEELIFQAGLQTRLNRFGATASILVTTIVFTLYHLEVFDRFPTGVELLGVSNLFLGLFTYACLRRWNGSLVALVIAHGFSNWLAIVAGPRV